MRISLLFAALFALCIPACERHDASELPAHYQHHADDHGHKKQAHGDHKAGSQKADTHSHNSESAPAKPAAAH